MVHDLITSNKRVAKNVPKIKELFIFFFQVAIYLKILCLLAHDIPENMSFVMYTKRVHNCNENHSSVDNVWYEEYKISTKYRTKENRISSFEKVN